MTHSPGTVLSVRGNARQSVAPDWASIYGSLEVVADSKPSALGDASRIVDQIITELVALGGVVAGPDTERHPLTWSTRTVGTRPEQVINPQTQQFEETGRISAQVSIQFSVRDFELLEPLTDRLAAVDSFNIHSVNWDVDDDNPGWPLVRAEAIHAAIRQGRDYAAALGCSLLSIDHVADAGLLGNDAPRVGRGGYAVALSSRMSGEAGGPSLDPVPQELTATIEARFTTSPVTLPAE